MAYTSAVISVCLVPCNAIDRFAQIADGDTSWYLTDHLGSTRDLVNNAGDVIAHTDYDGFGNATNDHDIRYQWTGRESDDVTGLQFNRARYFDGSTGRWMSEDPIGFQADDTNSYRYVRNNSIDNFDPSRLDYFYVYKSGMVSYDEGSWKGTKEIILEGWTGTKEKKVNRFGQYNFITVTSPNGATWNSG